MFHKSGRGRKIPDWMTVEEIMAMHNNAENIRDQVLFIFLYYSGARVSECCNCKVKDVIFAEDVIKIVQGKGSKDRILAMHATLKAVLKMWFGPHPDPESLIFLGLKPRQVDRIVTETAKKINTTKHIHPHTFRHTIAQHLRRGGKDVMTISRFLGHGDVSTTQIYADADTEDQKRMMRDF
jgi:site-specific recombinase XerD